VTSAERAPKRRITPARSRSCSAGLRRFNKPRQRVICEMLQLVDLRSRSELAPPEGPASSLKGRAKHPVVHVAYEDVEAYAKWIGKELPNRSRVGVRRARWTEWCRVRLGRCIHSGREAHGEYVQGEFPCRSQRRRFRGTARWEVFRPTATGCTRCRPMFGVDHGLVSGAQGDSAILLRELQSERWRTRQEP